MFGVLALLGLFGCGAASWEVGTDPTTGKGLYRLDMPFTQANAVEHLRVVPGQYGGHAKVLSDGSLRVSGIHTVTAVWLNRPVGATCDVRFEFRLSSGTVACWWVGGQGYGNSRDQGYAVVVGPASAQLFRRGAPVAGAARPPGTGEPGWLPARVRRNGAHIQVTLGGVEVLDYTDPDPLAGPSHAWFGFGAVNGGWESGVLYRNFEVETSAGPDDFALARHPPAGPRPRPNGALLYELDTSRALAPLWREDPGGGVALRNGLLAVGTGGNATPETVMEQALPEPLACEFSLEYPGPDCLNYRLNLWRDEDVPTDPRERAGWTVAIPDGGGQVQVAWQGGAGTTLAATPYFGPLASEKYEVRVECEGRDLRLFTAGALLLHATVPDGEPDPKSWHVGMSQTYGITHIRDLRVFALPPGSH